MENPIFEKKNILVTGGAGFIGSHLCERLLKEAKVICIDNFSNSHPQNINHLLQYPDFEFINHDINTPIDLESIKELDKFKIKFQGIQEIYHLACPTSPAEFEKLKLQSLLANSAAMINTLDLAVKYHAKYVFSSSSVVYGPVTDQKTIFKETDLGVVDQLSPRACYDEGKRFAETCVETYRQFYNVNAKTARVFTTYGPRMRLFQGNPIIDWIVAALERRDIVVNGGKGLSTSLCYVSDVVDGLIRLMDADDQVSLVNIGGGDVLTMVDVVKEIIILCESSSKIIEAEEMVFLTKKGAPDLSYTKENLGWFPLVRLDEGLRKTVDYVIANKEALLFGQR